jgi:hypothetical protein
MAVEMSIDPVSSKKLKKQFAAMEKHFPNELYKSLVAIGFDMKLIAQKKIKTDKHIITSRLRNSLFVQTPKQIHAKRATNKRVYSFQGGTGLRFLDVQLKKFEVAIGTNVIYAEYIEKLDSFLEYASSNVKVRKRFVEGYKRGKKKLKI